MTFLHTHVSTGGNWASGEDTSAADACASIDATVGGEWRVTPCTNQRQYIVCQEIPPVGAFIPASPPPSPWSGDRIAHRGRARPLYRTRSLGSL